MEKLTPRQLEAFAEIHHVGGLKNVLDWFMKREISLEGILIDFMALRPYTPTLQRFEPEVLLERIRIAAGKLIAEREHRAQFRP